MLSKNKLKWVRSLSVKKYRDAERAFLAEGPKVVEDLYGYFDCKLLAATAGFLREHAGWTADEVVEISEKELQQASQLRAPRDVLAVFSMPEDTPPVGVPDNRLVLALDAVQDPGNMGTIIRLADWFGIEEIFCSMNTADVYAPKVVQATMGALARVKVRYVDLPGWLSGLPESVPVYGTFLDGDNIYGQSLDGSGVLLMGNEGNGISDDVARHVTHRLFIPSYPRGRVTAESLNVAVATAVICAEFRRRSLG